MTVNTDSNTLAVHMNKIKLSEGNSKHSQHISHQHFLNWSLYISHSTLPPSGLQLNYHWKQHRRVSSHKSATTPACKPSWHGTTLTASSPFPVTDRGVTVRSRRTRLSLGSAESHFVTSSGVCDHTTGSGRVHRGMPAVTLPKLTSLTQLNDYLREYWVICVSLLRRHYL